MNSIIFPCAGLKPKSIFLLQRYCEDTESSDGSIPLEKVICLELLNTVLEELNSPVAIEHLCNDLHHEGINITEPKAVYSPERLVFEAGAS